MASSFSALTTVLSEHPVSYIEMFGMLSHNPNWAETIVANLKGSSQYHPTTRKCANIDDDDDNDRCSTATFVHMVGQMGRATSKGNEVK